MKDDDNIGQSAKQIVSYEEDEKWCSHGNDAIKNSSGNYKLETNKKTNEIIHYEIGYSNYTFRQLHVLQL